MDKIKIEVQNIINKQTHVIEFEWPFTWDMTKHNVEVFAEGFKAATYNHNKLLGMFRNGETIYPINDKFNYFI